MIHVRLKRGAVFDYSGNFALPTPTGSWTPTAAVATPDGTVVQTLTSTLSLITPTLSTGENYTLRIVATGAQTGAWPATTLVGGIKFVDGAGVVLKTSTFEIIVDREIV